MSRQWRSKSSRVGFRNIDTDAIWSCCRSWTVQVDNGYKGGKIGREHGGLGAQNLEGNTELFQAELADMPIFRESSLQDSVYQGLKVG